MKSVVRCSICLSSTCRYLHSSIPRGRFDREDTDGRIWLSVGKSRQILNHNETDTRNLNQICKFAKI